MPRGLALQGLVAATYTPLDANGALDLERIPPMVDFLIEQRIAGLYVLGSTGEGVLMTEAERKTVAECFVKATARRIPVLVQVGSESTETARDLASHAQACGADGISAISPMYFKPPSVEMLVNAMAHIAGGAPELPFYYYHIPALSGVSHDMIQFLELGRDRIPSLAGLKFTSTMAHEFQACVEYRSGEFEVMWGLDEMLMQGLAAGAKAAVGSTYNYAAPIYHRLLAAWHAAKIDEARHYQSQSQAVVRAFVETGMRSAQKAIMELIGYDCGPTRLPIPAMNSQQKELLRARLEEIGFFEWIK